MNKHEKTTPYLWGAHLSVSGGWRKMLERARALGCRCVQIFAANPRGWNGAAISRTSAARYRALAPGFGVGTLIIHAIFLVNPAAPDPAVRARSLRALRRDLVSAGRLGAVCLVVHPGSDRGVPGGEARVEQMLRRLLPHVPRGVRLLLECTAGGRHSVGQLAVLGRLARKLGPAVGVCLDSAHLCASGYALSEARDFRRLDRDLRRWIGYRRLGCFHLNDSRQPCGSRRDQHENLGEGHVGRQGLLRCLAHKPFRRLPFILETPGFDEQGPDQKNMRRLRNYARQAVRRST
jgi:deoxyribonuclease IV